MHPSSNEPGEQRPTNALTTVQWVVSVAGFWVGDILWSFHIEVNMNEWVHSILVLVNILGFSQFTQKMQAVCTLNNESSRV